jgi:hypothetical protein
VVLEYLDVHRDFFEPLVSGPLLDPKELPEAGALDLPSLPRWMRHFTPR